MKHSSRRTWMKTPHSRRAGTKTPLPAPIVFKGPGRGGLMRCDTDCGCSLTIWNGIFLGCGCVSRWDVRCLIFSRGDDIDRATIASKKSAGRRFACAAGCGSKEMDLAKRQFCSLLDRAMMMTLVELNRTTPDISSHRDNRASATCSRHRR